MGAIATHRNYYRVARQPCGRLALSELGVKVSFTQLKPFERLFGGDAVSKRKDADDEPGHGTRDEVERGS